MENGNADTVDFGKKFKTEPVPDDIPLPPVGAPAIQVTLASSQNGLGIHKSDTEPQDLFAAGSSTLASQGFRPRSNSAHALGETTPLQIIRKRAGSITDVPDSLKAKLNNKFYMPVSEYMERNGETNNQDTVRSFADFIKVSKRSGNAFIPKSPQRRIRRRLVYKNGECNVTHKHIRKVKRHYLADIFTTLVDLQWRWSLLIFIIAFIFTWLLFAFIWWIIGFTHGDYNPETKPTTPCVVAVNGFVTALLFSIETQHTIGYGSRSITDECPEAIVILMVQSILGVLIQALMTGMIFAKISRPKKRAETLMFSKQAVICKRDGDLCLMFRIGDMRSSHLVESHVRGLIIRRRVTKEGEVLPLDHRDINVGFDTGTDRLLIMWPVIVIHKIDKESPFWRMSKSDLERENFELIIVLEGCIESTGMTTQARTSYLPTEILWGHRLERLITFQKEGGEYQVDYTRFDCVVPVDTPTCSAKELAAQHSPSESEDGSSSGEEFTLYRAESIQTSEADEDELLLPDGTTAVHLSSM